MKGLLQLIWKYKYFFLFLLLEVLAFSMIYRQHYYHHSKILHSANATSGTFLKIYTNTTDYFKLNSLNKELMKENAELLSLKNNAYFIYFNDTVFLDSTETAQRFSFVSSRIIGKTYNRRNNYITIDKGKKDGIEEGFAVLGTNNTVLGKVVRVSENFSVVLSILSKKMLVSGKLKKNNYVGTVIWDTKEQNICHLVDIPKHIELQKGDTVVSSGYSFVFPEGVNIGTVEDFEVAQGNDFYTIRLKLCYDYQCLEFAYVAIDKFKAELDMVKPKESEMNE
jgi:rod shape-determining protein MreC